MINRMRSNPPKVIGGLPVVQFEDLQDESGRMGPFKGDTDRAARNFLIFRLKGENGIEGKVCLRPSGTEPKAKAYLEISTPPRPATMTDVVWNTQRADVDAKLTKVGKEFLAIAMG